MTIFYIVFFWLVFLHLGLIFICWLLLKQLELIKKLNDILSLQDDVIQNLIKAYDQKN